jgi:hypothetical protein
VPGSSVRPRTLARRAPRPAATYFPSDTCSYPRVAVRGPSPFSLRSGRLRGAERAYLWGSSVLEPGRSAPPAGAAVLRLQIRADLGRKTNHVLLEASSSMSVMTSALSN